MAKILIYLGFFSDSFLTTITFSQNQSAEKALKRYQEKWERMDKASTNPFPFVLSDFEDPTLVDLYLDQSLMAYQASSFLINENYSNANTPSIFDKYQVNHFIHANDSIHFKYKPKDVYYLSAHDKTKNPDLKAFGSNIKALVISSGILNYFAEEELRKIISSFDQLEYLEITEEAVYDSRLVLEKVIRFKSLEKIKYLASTHANIATVNYISENYSQLSGLWLAEIESERETPFPNPFLKSDKLTFLYFSFFGKLEGNELSHLKNLHFLYLSNQNYCNSLSDDSFLQLTNLSDLYLTTFDNEINFTNSPLQFMKLRVYHENGSSIRLKSLPELKELMIKADDDLSLEIDGTNTLKSIRCDVKEHLKFQSLSSQQELRSLILNGNSIDFFSAKKISPDTEINISFNYKFNLIPGSAFPKPKELHVNQNNIQRNKKKKM